MTDRRYDLDWLRIIAFGLLILYHCGMFYVTWDWHVKSRFASDAIEPLMMLTNPWRLTLLFLISGAATRFMADKMSAWKLTSSRMGRLWPPLLLAIALQFAFCLFLVPVRPVHAGPEPLLITDTVMTDHAIREQLGATVLDRFLPAV